MSRASALSKPGLLFDEFTVEQYVNEADPKNEYIAYILKGKRATYTLWRNKPNPKMLWAMSDKSLKPAKVRGYEWFYEAPCGRLIPSH